eukprot:jgi/Galph1/1309/GphlegSOOS_G5976.1
MQDLWNPSLYRNKHGFVFEKGEALTDLLEPQLTDLILDFGCGTGELTNKLFLLSGFVIGLDVSTSMVASCKEAFPHLELIVADGLYLCFRPVFDAIFSNAVLHWIPRPLKLLDNLRECLLIGKKLVVEFGGKANVELITSTLSGAVEKHTQLRWTGDKWFFPSLSEFEALLQQSHFIVTFSTLFDRPIKLQDGYHGLRNWLVQFCPELWKLLDTETIETVLSCVEKELEMHSQVFDGSSWYADYKRIRVVADQLASMRILCLHGFRQNGNSFRKRTGAIRKVLEGKANCIFEYVNGPHVVEPAGEILIEETGEKKWIGPQLSWWTAAGDGRQYVGWIETLEYLKTVFRTQNEENSSKGPFDGVLGFSQGAALCGLLCSLKEHPEYRVEEFSCIQFALMFSGFVSRAEQHQSLFKYRLHTPALICYGKADDLVDSSRSRDLAALFANPTIVEHDGGHLVPSGANEREQILNFVLQFRRGCCNQPPSSVNKISKPSNL